MRLLSRSWSTGLLAVSAFVLVSVTACATSVVGDARPAGAARDTVPTVLIIDGSGSMTTADAPGPRMDAAKSAAHELIGAMPDTAKLGLLTYGTNTDSSDASRDAGCADVTELAHLGPLDRQRLSTAIDSIRPSGYTPIARSLVTAAAQLPTDGSAQSIVLVSDGEDTCGQLPCDTARQLKTDHPGLTISTVGFRTEGSASQALACIATATGGLSVLAANAQQLAARLQATQDLSTAATALSDHGLGDISLGESADQISSEHPGFPTVSDGNRVIVVWQDCDLVFKSRVLVEIAPHDGGRTVDGVTRGSPVGRAIELYGDPLATDTSASSGTRLTFTAAADSDSAYQIDVDGYSNGVQISGTITRIVLCRCKPAVDAGPITEVYPADYNLNESVASSIPYSVGLFFKDPTSTWWCQIDQGEVRCFRGWTGNDFMGPLNIPGEPSSVTEMYASDGVRYVPNGIANAANSGSVQFIYAKPSDTARRNFARTKVLDYGHAITAGGHSCTMRHSGITCDSTYDSAGFTFSATSYTFR